MGRYIPQQYMHYALRLVFLNRFYNAYIFLEEEGEESENSVLTSYRSHSHSVLLTMVCH